MRAWRTPIAAALVAASAVTAAAQEVIHRFDSRVVVAQDGELTVTETLRVRAEGREIKRGIFRDFPLTFTDASGALREVTFELLDVTRDGRPEPHFTERRSGNIRRIYAGDKDVIIPRGDHTYVFRYRTGRQLRWFDGKPELNWNVTGNFWNFPIRAATYRLDLPGGVAPVRWTAFTGPRGARGTDWRGEIGPLNALTVATTRVLQPTEGLTVVAEIPAGAVDAPSEADELRYAFMDNRRWIYGGLGFLIVFGYYLAAWRAVGRDPRGGVIIPLFHPPKGISPALANYVHNWGFSRDRWRAFTAAALSLAVRGLLRFEEAGGKPVFVLTERKPDGGLTALPPGERAIHDWLDGRAGRVTIDRANGASVAEIGADFTRSVEAENKNRFFRRNLGYVLAGFAMTVVVFVGLFVWGGLREEDIIVIAASVFGSFWLGMFLVPVGLALFRARSFSAVARAALTIVVLGVFFSIGGNIASSFDGIGDLLPSFGRFLAGNPFPIMLVAAFAALNGLFVYLMRAPTALGRPIMDQLEGFKLYLETAETPRLNMQAPELTAERFEALLPYAVALGVEKPWSDAFATALARAHPGEPAQPYRPAWYGGAWSGATIGDAVASTVSSTSSALASAVPVSSSSSGFSSSGGGGSGGGGGGGGGGGW